MNDSVAHGHEHTTLREGLIEVGEAVLLAVVPGFIQLG